ncbi:MAG: nicotinate (nicotinamide) nucleotide adenylyltransferase [Blastocatellia bacterium]|nr:nicotinate (nicotinamide) nucleotide adenylyltransferase [Blastocatellia bacterium]
MKHIAYFGGTFDPVHSGHLAIAREVTSLFHLDRFYFLPAYHAPHKPDRPPTLALHRYAMLCLATAEEKRVFVSPHEIEKNEKRYTIDTIAELQKKHLHDAVYFVMGADSWADIRTWKEWETLLLTSNHIVMGRPGFPLEAQHVTDPIRSRIIDVRGSSSFSRQDSPAGTNIYFTDAVHSAASATNLRTDLRDGSLDRTDHLPLEVANYIEKYEVYR